MPATTPAVLAIEDVRLNLGGTQILDGVSLTVQPGELLAIIGPNGAGKTSLLNVVSGLLPATAGRVMFGGDDVTTAPPYRRARRGLARSFQVTSVFPALPVIENVRLAARAARGGSWMFWRSALARDEIHDETAQVLERTQLTAVAGRPAGALSHGEKRKLELAIALAGAPTVLVLDEPTAGLSVEDLPGLIEIVRAVRARGTTVVMVEHRMDVVVDLADRIAVLHHGALLACDRPSRVMADEAVQQAYLGQPL